jgi:hypothetical protein
VEALKGLLIGFVVVFASGCATGYQQVSSDKLVNKPPQVNPELAPAKVNVKRDNRFFMSALDGRFLIDGNHIITLSRGETYSFDMNPGNYNFGVISYQPVMMVPVKFSRELEVELSPGKSYYFNIVPLFKGTGVGLDIVQEN